MNRINIKIVVLLFLVIFFPLKVNANETEVKDVFTLTEVSGYDYGSDKDHPATLSIKRWDKADNVFLVDYSWGPGGLEDVSLKGNIIDELVNIEFDSAPEFTSYGYSKDIINNISKSGNEITFDFKVSSDKTANKPSIINVAADYLGEKYQYYIVFMPHSETKYDIMLADGKNNHIFDDGNIYKSEYGNLVKLLSVPNDVNSISIECLRQSVKNENYTGTNTKWIWDGEMYARINFGNYIRFDGSGDRLGENFSQPLPLKPGVNIVEVCIEDTNIKYSNKAQKITKTLEGLTNNNKSALMLINQYYTFLVYKEGEVGTEEAKKSDTSIKTIEASQLGASNILCSEYKIGINEENGNYILPLPENLPSSGTTVYDKVIVGVIPNDPMAKFEILDPVGDRIGMYQAVKVRNADTSLKDHFDIKVTAADGTEKIHTVELTQNSSDSSVNNISFKNGVLKDYITRKTVNFDPEKHLYILQSDKEEDYATIDSAEGTSVYINGVKQDSVESGSYNIDLSGMVAKLQIRAADGVAETTYYFAKQDENDNVLLDGQSDSTKDTAQKMLTGWNSRSDQEKKNNTDPLYWATYMSAATGMDLSGTTAYDVTKHNMVYGSDWGACILELVMTGNDPYNYNGINYVEGLKKCKDSNGDYGPFASNTWALMAFRACGEPIEDYLVESVKGTAKSVTGGDIRPWALSALTDWSVVPKDEIVIMALDMKGTLGKDGLWGNAYTNGCYLTGIGSSGVNIDYFGTNEKPFLQNLAENYMTEDYKFKYVGEADKYVKDVILGLGDLIHERSIWASYALTNDKMKQLIDQAKDIDLSSATDEEKTALNQAIDAAEAVQNAESGYGPAYYALYEAMKQIDDRYNLHVRLCSWDQSQKIDKVMADIDALAGKELTFASASDIKTVTDAYKALIEEDKRFADYVENADKLDQVAENYAKLIDEAIVKADTSSEKGKLVSKENTAAIDQVRSALDSLAEDQQKNVKNIEAFKELEKTYTDSVAELVSAVDAAMTKAKEDTSDGTIVSKEASASIEAIKSDLDKLTEDQQKQITGLDGFKDLDAAYTAKVGEIVADIDESITNLKDSSKDGTVVNQTNTAAVKETKEKLDMLTDSQQASVSGLDTFTALDATYSDSVEKLIKAVDDAIAKVDETSKGGTVVSTEATKAIDEINKALGDLTEEQKGKLTNAESFASLESAYKDAVAKEVKAVEDEINALQSVNSEEMTDEEKASVGKTLDRIDNLTEDQQKEISNLASLKPYEDVVRAEKANAAISALPNPVTSLNQKDAVTAAREAYDKLSKEAVEKLKAMDPDAEKKLLAAEAAIKALENGENPQKEESKEETLPKVGQKVTVSGKIYKITASSKVKKTVSLIGTKSKKIKSLSVPSAISIKKYRYKVTTIGAGAVKKRTKLKKLVIGNNVVNIGANAFFGCKNLKKVTIGTNISVIGGKAFYGCKKLKKIVIRGKKLKKVGQKAFSGIYKKAVIRVPKSKKNVYKKILKGKGQKKTVKIK